MIFNASLTFALTVGYSSLGGSPGMLESAPRCQGNKVLIPFDGGITTCLRTGDEVAKERRVFA